MMVVRIRPAVAADAPELARVHVESWRWAYPGLVPQDYLDALSVERRTRYWARIILAEDARAITWTARDPRGCCGLAAAGPARPEAAGVGEVYAIYVAPRAVGRGIGHALLTYAVAQLRATLCASAILWVLARNERARRFYERQGWSSDGSLRYEWLGGEALPVVRYRRSL